MTVRRSRFVHLVGSVPLADAASVFKASARLLGSRLARFPDGETGQTRRWISMQRHVAQNHPWFQPAATRSHSPGIAYEHFRLIAGANAAALEFGSLGYVEPAKSSYALFAGLKREGTIPQDARFLVTFPTPAAFLWCYVTPDERTAVEPAYLRRLAREVGEVLDAIPHSDLAIQWDTVHEILMIEGARDSSLTEEDHLARLIAVGNMVPAAVELGYHFCYGYANRKHTVEPADTGLLVHIANRLTTGVGRPIQFFHFPVPRDRDDATFFAPLRGLALDPLTEVYLGLVHWTDGIEGARRRMRAAEPYLAHFGVATECGLRARPVDLIEPLLALHAEAADDLLA